MHHRDRLVLVQDFSDAVAVARAAGLQRAPFHGVAAAARQVVKHYRPVAAGGKPLAGVASDEARSPGHENVQSIPQTAA
jgi:hypothetical protein